MLFRPFFLHFPVGVPKEVGRSAVVIQKEGDSAAVGCPAESRAPFSPSFKSF